MSHQASILLLGRPILSVKTFYFMRIGVVNLEGLWYSQYTYCRNIYFKIKTDGHKLATIKKKTYDNHTNLTIIKINWMVIIY